MRIEQIEDQAVKMEAAAMVGNLRKLADILTNDWSRPTVKKVATFFAVGALTLRRLDDDRFWTPDVFKNKS